MMQKKYLLKNSSYDPYYNLALEEFLLRNFKEGLIVMFWQNRNTIVVGRNQNALEEINQTYVKEHEITVARRMTGGGTVYHDLGNLNFSFFSDREDSGEDSMKKFAGEIIGALKELGAEAAFSGRNDILIDGKKVSGTAQAIVGKRILNHGCLLFQEDLNIVSECLRVKADKFTSKSVKSVRSRVGNIRDYLKEAMTTAEFKEYLTNYVLRSGEFEILDLSQEDLAKVQKLRDEKYATWDWVFGCPIGAGFHHYQKYPGGSLDVYADVKKGRMEKIKIYGDFMASAEISKVEELLTGKRHKLEEIQKLLSGIRTEEYFGSISAEQVARAICGESPAEDAGNEE